MPTRHYRRCPLPPAFGRADGPGAVAGGVGALIQGLNRLLTDRATSPNRHLLQWPVQPVDERPIVRTCSIHRRRFENFPQCESSGDRLQRRPGTQCLFSVEVCHGSVGIVRNGCTNFADAARHRLCRLSSAGHPPAVLLKLGGYVLGDGQPDGGDLTVSGEGRGAMCTSIEEWFPEIGTLLFTRPSLRWRTNSYLYQI
jgi:hypothetical protein